MNDITHSQTTVLGLDYSLYKTYYAPYEFILNILSIMLIFSMTMNIGPHWYSSSRILPHKNEIPAWTITYDLSSLPEPLDLDLQKSVELWKSNPKIVYTAKNVTVPMYIWNYLTEEMGLPNIAAAGVFGNMMVESGNRTFNVRPYVYSPGNAYYGLCQWNTGGHHSGINGGTLEEQMEYLERTIESEMGSSNYQRLLNATTPEEASIIFGTWYERCASPASRQNEAVRAYERFVP